MTVYQVKFQGKSGSVYYLDCGTLEQAQEFYDRLEGRAGIQRWNVELQGYEDVLSYPAPGD